MALYKPAVPLYDKETWVEMTDNWIPEDGFESEEELWFRIDRMYPGRTRFDLFHGMQKIEAVRVQ